MSRSRRLAAAVLGCSLCALAGASPAVAASPGTAAAPAAVSSVAAAASGGTSGYAAEGGRYTSVSANWTQPAFNCASGTGPAAYWVGLDGMTDSTMAQAGTMTQCSGGKAVMNAWYELYPAAPVSFTNPLSAGDGMSASVTTDGAGNFTLTVTDATKGWSVTAHHALAGAQLSSAEVMTDVPASSVSGGTPPGAALVAFNGALVNGAALGASSPTAVVAPGTVVSPLTGGEAFTVSHGLVS